jgi:hypothetical protein
MKPTLPLFFALAGLANAAPLPGPVRDLGMGLVYFRVHELPNDIPSPQAGQPLAACVLDLRFAKTDAASPAALKAWVRFNASVRTPIFVLENSGTDPALLAALTGSGPAGQVVLAPDSEKLAPDIAVKVTPELDRRAYDALEKGEAVASLLTDFPDKPRIDEAYLEKEHISDSAAPDVPDEKPLAARPLVDVMLQRAVQLHRGLLAMRRI